ncbi:MAG: hypothetical protein ACODAU_07865 [Myxococcota bacterium]
MSPHRAPLAARPRRWTTLLLLAVPALLVLRGCDCRVDGRLAPGVTEVNPLLDRIYFEGIPGTVVDPSPDVPKILVVELSRPTILIEDDDVSVSVAVREGTSTERHPVSPSAPLEQIPCDNQHLEGMTCALRLPLDPGPPIATHPGAQIEVTINPHDWLVLLSSDEDREVFQNPIRASFRIGTEGSDGDPPYVADVETLHDPALPAPFAQEGGQADHEAVVATHSPTRIWFSEPMASVASHTLPDDAAAWAPRVQQVVGDDPRGPFEAIYNRTAAGFIPGQDYCITLVPPIGELFPMPFGSEDVTGEPLVPPFDHLDPELALEARLAARGTGATTDICFRTGEVRVDAPALGDPAPFAADTLPVDFIDRVHERADCGERSAYHVWMRMGDNALGDGVGFSGAPMRFDADALELTDQRLEQGEMRGDRAVPVRSGQLEVPVPAAVRDACLAADPERCPVDLRIDTCSQCGATETCQLGDVTSLLADLVPPPNVEDDSLVVEDADTNDGVIDRVCVDLEESPRTGEVLRIEVGFIAFIIPTRRSFDFTRNHFAVEVSELGGGRERWCVNGLDLEAEGPTLVTEVGASTRDEAGNVGASDVVEVSCDPPPRKHIARDGRRSAFALDRAGVPHVALATDNEVKLLRWDAENDRWQGYPAFEILPFPQDTLVELPEERHIGGTIDLAFNWRDEPLVCFTHAEVPEDEPPGWEISADADLEVVMLPRQTDEDLGEIRQPYRQRISGRARNMGCAIGARRNRTSADRDYLVAFAERLAGLGLRYLHDTGPESEERAFHITNRFRARSVQEHLRERDPVMVELGVLPAIAVDDRDAFWLATRTIGGPVAIFGEHGFISAEEAPSFRVGDFDETLRWIPFANEGHGQSGFGQRIAARGDGEVAVLYTDPSFRLRLVHRRPGDPQPLKARGLPLAMDIPGLDAGGTPGVMEATERVTPNLRNNGNLASTQGLLPGIPSDITFLPGEPLPAVAWAAASPTDELDHARDYHALLVARPSVDTASAYDIDTIDGRVELSAGVHLAANGAGKLRIAYHNGLGRRNDDHFNPDDNDDDDDDDDDDGDPFNLHELTNRGSLSFYRDEDEDEIFSRRSKRGTARCFSDRLLVQDRPGPRGASAGMDDAAAAGVPRPAIDPDPCGRGADVGLTEEVTYRLLQQAMNGQPPPNRPPSRYRRLPGESTEDYAVRTNAHRRDMLLLLRDLVGDLSFLDGVFPRADEESWNDWGDEADDLNPRNFDEELFSNPEPQEGAPPSAGALDALFLAFDELFDDLCGMRAEPDVCDADADPESHPLDRDRTGPLATQLCPSPGAFERNPNGYYPGKYYRTDPDSSPPDLSLDPYGEQALAAHTEHFGPDADDPDAFKNDSLAPPRSSLTPGEQPGILNLFFRGLELGEQGVFRDGSQLCEARDNECLVPPVAIPMPDDDSEIILDPPEDLEVTTGSTMTSIMRARGSQGVFASLDDIACPQVRLGARARLRGLPDDGSTEVFDPRGRLQGGCCEGYETIPCNTTRDCQDAGLVFTECEGGLCHTSLPCSEDGPSQYFDQECSRSCISSLQDRCIRGVACVPSACLRTEPRYCEDRNPRLDVATRQRIRNRLCGEDADGATCRSFYDLLEADGQLTGDPNASLIEATLAATDDRACAPGASCRDAYGSGKVGVMRPFLAHHTLRLLASAMGDGGGAPLTQFVGAIPDIASEIAGSLSRLKRRHVEIARVEWKEHRDGDLHLQGYLDLTLKMEGDRVELDILPRGRDLTNFDVRVRLQPYFFPQDPPFGDRCDGCGRRRPDLTMRWRVVSAGLFVTGTDQPIDASDLANCGCGEIFFEWLLGCNACDVDIQADGVDLGSNLAEIGPNINRVTTRTLRKHEFALSQVFYALQMEPLVAGALLGRKEAVRAVADLPTCSPGGVSDDPSTQCGPNWTPPDRVDTVEALRIRRLSDGRAGAAVLARENP